MIRDLLCASQRIRSGTPPNILKSVGGFFKVRSLLHLLLTGWQLGLLSLFLLTSCSGIATETATVHLSATLTSAPQIIVQEPSTTPTITRTPLLATSTPSPISIWFSPSLPLAFMDNVELPSDYIFAQSADVASIVLEPGSESSGAGDVQTVSTWIYALVAPFPTITDGITYQDLRSAWGGAGIGEFSGLPLLMDERTWAVFSMLWGEPTDGAVKLLPPQGLQEYAWSQRLSWAIIPFEELNPRWKVLTIDGQSPLWLAFDPASYPLSVPISMFTKSEATGLADIYLPSTNRDAEKITTVILTGVTALVRATAETMRRNGITYPAASIGDLLREADITHISNEIPFTPDCPLPNPLQPDLKFCSKPEYIELLEYVGTDIVELTGDHFGDWGSEAMLFTLDLYRRAGIPYYGGGENEAEAKKAYLIEHNGNKLAFIGCNAKGKSYTTAHGDNPGAVDCDFEWLSSEIPRLRADGYLPLFTFQHFEYYNYQQTPNMVADFHSIADMGAVIISGSQAHQPHGMEFYQDAFLHYGLGNLFFDQYHMGFATGSGFLDRHVFYDGTHVSTELIGIRFVDFARPRLMTPDEKQMLLESVFEASGWE